MSLPPLPDSYDGTGYDFMEKLEGGWHPIGLWGSDGWNLGNWPLQIVCHYDGPQDGGPWGFCSYTEGDLDIKEFPTREERDHATDEYFVWYNEFHSVEGAPKHIRDGRLGPCKI